MRKARAVFIQPNDGPPVSSNEKESTPDLMENLGLFGIMAVEGQGAPETGVLTTPIGSQVDDVG